MKIAVLVNKHRIANGWTPLDQKQCEDLAPVWIEIFDNERIPVSAYEELYTKAMHRIGSLQGEGKKAPDFNAMFLASIWLGDAELRWKYHPRPNQLMAESELERCKYCLGTGWEYVKESYPREVARCRCGKIPGQKF